MPKFKLLLPVKLNRWTKTPNIVFDQLMPNLRDTELRLLLVLIRQTAGWNREGRSAVLSYRLLQAKTGRSSEAIARAIASLKAQHFIHTNAKPKGQRALTTEVPRTALRRATIQRQRK